MPEKELWLLYQNTQLFLLNRLIVGEDGKVAYERVKGKKPSTLGLEFGEKILFKKNTALKN